MTPNNIFGWQLQLNVKIMSSSIMNHTGALNLSNMQFWSLHAFALEVAKSLNDAPLNYIEKFEKIEKIFGSTPDIEINEFFSKEESEFWSTVFSSLAQQVYDRAVGNQLKQDWQIWHIWAACSISKLFYSSFKHLTMISEEQFSEEYLLTKLGMTSYKVGEYKNALELFFKALEVNPNSSSLHHLIGLAYKRIGDNNKSEIYLKRARDINGNIGLF